MGWNLIPHFLAHLHSWSISFWCFYVSSMVSIWWKKTQSSANRQILFQQILFQPQCHLYTRKTTVDQEQCPAAHQTKQVPIFAPLTTTLCCLLHRNESIHSKDISLMPYPWSLHFTSSWGGLLKACSKSNMNVSQSWAVNSTPQYLPVVFTGLENTPKVANTGKKMVSWTFSPWNNNRNLNQVDLNFLTLK